MSMEERTGGTNVCVCVKPARLAHFKSIKPQKISCSNSIINGHKSFFLTVHHILQRTVCKGVAAPGYLYLFFFFHCPYHWPSVTMWHLESQICLRDALSYICNCVFFLLEEYITLFSELSCFHYVPMDI